ncbi:MAG: carbohydrate binding family 9 domain-containing protein [Armatimonadetes bacterium]|nr:carbohydrate binding family 9 domain-containing protein [Armatimonadota bacterium]MCX7968160.1 carbohydrate binding family 9 domain-containing protein [Armatimonadota bacterium]MDW8142030.1 carbohydrate binding family 9 domain-containing protein [Armatimonadota bacterium]
MSRLTIHAGIICLLVVAQVNPHERPSVKVFGVNENYEVVAPLVEEHPVVDGKINESVWEKAAKVWGFRQVSPHLGQPATQDTTVYILTGKDKLFFAFRCSVRGKNSIRAYETRYDAQMRRDERVTIFLDTLHTHDRAYSFTVNSRGAKADERFGNSEWNGQWEAAVQVGDTEWVAEIAIPYSILTFDPNRPSWGINFGRYVSETDEWTSWAFEPERPFDMRYRPHLVGMPLNEQKTKTNNFVKRWLLKSFSVADYRLNGEDKGFGNNYGVDGEWTIRSNLALRFVFKPDFSEIEEAFESIDVSYVEQFVPDQREFFVQGSEFFSEVAVAGELWRRGSEPSLFFSRRVEKFDLGAKLTGAIGDSRLGFLSTHNFENSEHTFVLNFNRSLGTRGRTYFGYVDALREGSFNRGFVVGGETSFGQRNRFWLRGSYARHFSSDDKRDGGAGSVRFGYGDEQWFVSLGYNAFSPNFRPLLSYTPRTDFKRWSVFINRNFRSKGKEFYRDASFSVNWGRGETFDGKFFEHSYGLNFRLELKDQTEISLGWNRNKHAEYHIREEPFNDRSFWLSLDLGGNKPLRADLSYGFGRAFDGRYTQPRISIRWDKPDGSWRVRLDWSQRHQTYGDGRKQTVKAHEINITRVLSRDKWFVLRYYNRSGDYSITNFALSFRIRRENGEELFLILGDPRATETKTRIAVKWILPFRF